jgi:hypothetical protein
MIEILFSVEEAFGIIDRGAIRRRSARGCRRSGISRRYIDGAVTGEVETSSSVTGAAWSRRLGNDVPTASSPRCARPLRHRAPHLAISRAHDGPHRRARPRSTPRRSSPRRKLRMLDRVSQFALAAAVAGVAAVGRGLRGISTASAPASSSAPA